MVDKGLLSLIYRKRIVLLHQQEKEEFLGEKICKGHKDANYKRKINKWVYVQFHQHHTMSSISDYQIGKG